MEEAWGGALFCVGPRGGRPPSVGCVRRDGRPCGEKGRPAREHPTAARVSHSTRQGERPLTVTDRLYAPSA